MINKPNTTKREKSEEIMRTIHILPTASPYNTYNAANYDKQYRKNNIFIQFMPHDCEL